MRTLLILILMAAAAHAQSVYIGKKQIEPAHVVERNSKVYLHQKDLRELGDILILPNIGGKTATAWRPGIGLQVVIREGKGAVRESDGLYLGIDVLEKKLGLKVDYKGSVIVIHSEMPEVRQKRVGIGPGYAMPDLTLPRIGRGKPVTLSKLESSVLLYFWSSWEKGRDDLKEWDRYFVKNKKKVTVVAVAVDLQKDRAESYVPSGLKMPVVWDRDGRTAAMLGLERLPHWILIDETGLIRGQGSRLDRKAFSEILEEERLPKKEWRGRAYLPEPKSLDDWQDAKNDHPQDPWVLLGLAAAYTADGLGAAAHDYAKRAASKGGVRPFAAIARAAAFLSDDKKDDAVKVLTEVRRHFPECQLVRKNIWVIQHPDRFYKGAIDFSWQKDQEKLERATEGK